MKLIKELEDRRIEEAFAKKTYGPDPHKSNPNVKAVNLELSWSSKYNGVSMRVMDDDFDITDEMEDAFERIGELAEITYDWHPHHGVSDAQEQELINAAREIIGHVIPNANISFDQDEISS